MWKALALTLLSQVPAGERAPTLPEAVLAIHADLARTSSETRQSIRYISMHNVPQAEREAYTAMLAGHVNQLSRSRLPEKPRLIGGYLARVNIEDYGWEPETWDRLANDPYVTIQAILAAKVVDAYEWWEGGVWPGDGKYYAAKAFQYRRGVVKEERKVTALAPWLYDDADGKAKLEEIVNWTQSKIPFVTAPWFVNQTATASDNRLYYFFIGVKDKKTFEETGGFDRKLFEKFRLPLREAVAVSGVTREPRALVFFDSAGGGYTFSVDFIKAFGDANPLDNLGKGIEGQGDAFEAFILGANGFWRTALFNKKGELQPFVPPEIAKDHTRTGNDGRVLSHVSCLGCHQKGGMQKPDAFIRNLVNPPLELRTKDYEKYREAKEEYLGDLDDFLERVILLNERAVKRVTGMESVKWQASFSKAFEDYENRKVTAEWAAFELGVPVDELRRKMLAWVKAGYPLSPTASVFVHEGKRARAIGVRQFEPIIAELYAVVKGVK